MTHFINTSLIVTLLLLITHSSFFSQKSIFEEDTVAFKYYRYRYGDTIQRKKDWTLIGQEKKLIDNLGYSPFLGKYEDTALVRTIYMDSNKNVHWDVICMYQYNDTSSKYFMNSLLSSISTLFYDYDESNTEILSRIPCESKTCLPLFRTHLRDGHIIYETEIKEKPRVIFSLSLSQSDTARELPKIFNECYVKSMSLNELNLIYTGDTTILYPKDNRPISCYKFIAYSFHFIYDMEEYLVQYNEILFEKASLLPVRLVYKRGDRFDSKYYSKPSYFLDFITAVIEIH